MQRLALAYHTGYYLTQRRHSVVARFYAVVAYALAQLVDYLLARAHSDIGCDKYFLKLFEKILVYLHKRAHHRFDAAHQCAAGLAQTLAQLTQKAHPIYFPSVC